MASRYCRALVRTIIDLPGDGSYMLFIPRRIRAGSAPVIARPRARGRVAHVDAKGDPGTSSCHVSSLVKEPPHQLYS